MDSQSPFHLDVDTLTRSSDSISSTSSYDESKTPPTPRTSINLQFLEAAKLGNDDMVQALLAQGANINATNQKRNTALILATKKNRVTTVKLLLTYKDIMIDIKNEDWKSAVVIANEKKYNEILFVLNKYRSENTPNVSPARTRSRTPRSRVSASPSPSPKNTSPHSHSPKNLSIPYSSPRGSNIAGNFELEEAIKALSLRYPENPAVTFSAFSPPTVTKAESPKSLAEELVTTADASQNKKNSLK
jgi:hypothetical protein